jgi:hypothetical protein
MAGEASEEPAFIPRGMVSRGLESSRPRFDCSVPGRFPTEDAERFDSLPSVTGVKYLREAF